MPGDTVQYAGHTAEEPSSALMEPTVRTISKNCE